MDGRVAVRGLFQRAMVPPHTPKDKKYSLLPGGVVGLMASRDTRVARMERAALGEIDKLL